MTGTVECFGRNYQFSRVAGGVAPASQAKAEEEKILLLRLSSRGLGEVEQTDVLVRLQEVWRDRREELTLGLGRVEQVKIHTNGCPLKSASILTSKVCLCIYLVFLAFSNQIRCNGLHLQHYEHILSEASTEIGELEGSINNKVCMSIYIL